MSRVLRVYNSDHKIAVQDGGTITLDTGDLVGTTVITGNLEGFLGMIITSEKLVEPS